jgi:N6-adenosine-specific RNA methylase IME4
LIPFPDKKYNIIYADPPWSYDDPSKHRGGALRYYKTMSIEEIARLPIKDITEENAILFMWTTFPKIFESEKVISSWGFTYKTNAFTWVKKNKVSTDKNFWGMGRWTRSNAEVCLLAVKGKPKRISAGVHSIIEHPIQEHSKKPDIVRDKIVELVGDLPRIELFARETAKGWDSWGNEV